MNELLELVLELETHVWVNLLSLIVAKQKNKRNRRRLLRAPIAAWVEAQFDASQRGKKELKSSRDKNESTRRSGEGREEPAL